MNKSDLNFQCRITRIYLTVRSTTETSGVGTRKAMPVSLPFSSGITYVINKFV